MRAGVIGAPRTNFNQRAVKAIQQYHLSATARCQAFYWNLNAYLLPTIMTDTQDEGFQAAQICGCVMTRTEELQLPLGKINL